MRGRKCRGERERETGRDRERDLERVRHSTRRLDARAGVGGAAWGGGGGAYRTFKI